jgi:RNA polymerase-binding protein DksA
VEEIAGSSDNHLGETATATLDREIDFTLGENAEQVLAEIDAALKRIEEGTYGTCVRCGKEISPERLEAYPWASLCIDDAREAERR